MNKILLRAQRFVVEWCQRQLPDGSLYAREIIRHPGAVVILPLIDPQTVCLLRNFRPTVDRFLWELPAGTLNVGEDPAVAAVRELAEETGYRCGRLTHLHSFHASPGIMDERMHVYAASDLTAGETALEVGEVIETHAVRWSEVDRMLRRREIEDSKTLVTLLWYLRYREYA